MRARLAGLLLPVVLGLTGCAALTARPLSDDGVRLALTVGVSTRADVSKAFGLATVNSFASGYEVWVYSDKRHVPPATGLIPVVGPVIAILGAVKHERELVILFDREGVVKKYRLRES
ncbi:hypothetical protein [Massilia sp. DWR3-1-1]|uniref:hypothetical protein n=1 Tax=Massilia sp. DWR3-1-1 TaxID=2804559 RepID=UPI003CF69A7C